MIIDTNDGQSRQTDVIVFDRRIAPPLQLSATTEEAAIPCESVLFAVEVKSQLTRTNLEDSIAWARSVKDRKFSRHVHQGIVLNQVNSVPCALFAYDTDLSEPSGLLRAQRWPIPLDEYLLN